MSTDTSNTTTLTDEERSSFERLSDRFEDEPIGEFFEAVLQSDDSEEARS